MELKYKIFILSAFVMSVISVILSLSFISAPHDPNVLPVIVGILALLVTILVGWQIFTLFEFKGEIKRMTEQNAILQIGSDTNSVLMFMAMSEFYYVRLTNDPKINDGYKYIKYTLCAVSHAVNIKSTDTVNTLVKSMLEVIANPKDIYFLKEEKNDLIKTISTIRYDGNIDRFEELVCRIAECQVGSS